MMILNRAFKNSRPQLNIVLINTNRSDLSLFSLSNISRGILAESYAGVPIGEYNDYFKVE